MTRKLDYSRGRPAERAAATPLRHASLVATVVGALGFAGALLYAGNGAASVAYCLLTDGAIVVAWLAAAAGWGAWPARWFLRGSAKARDAAAGDDPAGHCPLLAAVTAISLGLGVLSLIELGLGLAGALGRGLGFGLIGLGWVLGGTWLIARWNTTSNDATPSPGTPGEGRGGGQGSQISDLRFQIPDSKFQIADDRRWSWLWLLAVPLLAAALVAAMFPSGMLWKPEEPHGYDAVEYHLQVPREWYEAGRIVPLQHNVFSYFPFGVEMHYLLAMQLKGGGWPAMYLAQLMHLAMMGLAVAAACGFANQLAPNRRIAIIATLAGATVPWLGQLAPLAFNEGGLLLFGTMSVGWVVVAVRRGWRVEDGRSSMEDGGSKATTPSSDLHPPSSRRLATLAGLFAGFACGVKLTGVPLFLLAVPVAMFVVLVRRSPRAAILQALVFGVAGMLVFSPWLIRNLAWCGNPVFPEGTALFGQAHFTGAQVQRWHAAHSPRADQQSIGARLAEFAMQVLVNWQFGYVLLPLAAMAIVIGWWRMETKLLAVLLLIHAAFWLGFTHLQGRFFAPAIPLAVFAIAAAPWKRSESRPSGSGKSDGAGSASNPLPHGRGSSVGILAISAAVIVSAIVGFWNVHARLSDRLAGLHDDQGKDARGTILANNDILGTLLPEDLARFPVDDPKAQLILVGDAQAFTYPIPSSRLQYRTPFDVREGPEVSVFDAYSVQSRDDRTWLRIDPDELYRFNQYYPPFPQIPREAQGHPQWQRGAPPYVVMPGQLLIRQRSP